MTGIIGIILLKAYAQTKVKRKFEQRSLEREGTKMIEFRNFTFQYDSQAEATLKISI